MSLVRYFHTLRHLRPVQITGRLWHRLNPAKPDLRAAPALREPSGSWLPGIERPASLLGADTFRFLNAEGQVRVQADWNAPGRDKLWLYNLHYFDDLNAHGAMARTAWQRALIDRWVRENPPGSGNGWEPYPTSLRCVNWIKWAWAGNALEPAWRQSLAVQVRWLAKHIEWHLLGNHLFENAKALVFAGLFFDGAEADGWLRQGLRILAREVPEQILPDGGHFELSPMYHAIILEGLLDLLNASRMWIGRLPGALVSDWRAAASRMLVWLRGMSHPDGEIAFFNDAAMGITANYSALSAYAGRIGLRVEASESVAGTTSTIACEHFVDSGYVRLATKDAVALLDVARIGPDYLPGHAHADTLSFELSVFGQRVLVNSGISQYGLGAERLRQRATAAHNTVVIDAADSSEVWGGFRVARRAAPFDLSIDRGSEQAAVVCAHDGYRRLPGRPVHRRRWTMHAKGLRVSDAIEGGFQSAVAHLYLHPDVSVTGNGASGRLRLRDGHELNWSVRGARAGIVAATWHPEFGLGMSCQCIELVFADREVHFELVWD